MASFATPTDLKKRYDERTIAELASDTGVKVADITIDPNVLQALADATGAVVSACSVAGMYDRDTLENKLSVEGADHLKRITCDVAIYYLFRRRPLYSQEELTSAKEEAEDFLDRIRRGERLFELAAAVDPHEEAGVPDVDGPSVATYNRLQLLADRTKNFYPHRGSRLPRGRQGG